MVAAAGIRTSRTAVALDPSSSAAALRRRAKRLPEAALRRRAKRLFEAAVPLDVKNCSCLPAVFHFLERKAVPGDCLHIN